MAMAPALCLSPDLDLISDPHLIIWLMRKHLFQNLILYRILVLTCCWCLNLWSLILSPLLAGHRCNFSSSLLAARHRSFSFPPLGWSPTQSPARLQGWSSSPPRLLCPLHRWSKTVSSHAHASCGPKSQSSLSQRSSIVAPGCWFRSFIGFSPLAQEGICWVFPYTSVRS